MRFACSLYLLLALGELAAAVVGVDLDDRDRDRIEVPEPAWMEESSALGLAERSGSLIVYVFTTGNLALDGFWTSDAVAASQQQPVVHVGGSLTAPQAAAWDVVELPAVVLVDHHGNPWSRLQGKAVKPAAVEQLVLQADGMFTRLRAQITEDIARSVEQAGVERKLPGVIATLQRYAALAGLPEAVTARQELDRILDRGLVELQALAAQMATDPAAARRQLPRFERLYANTPLEAQAQRVRDGLPIESTPAASGQQAPASADDAPVDFLGGD